MSDHTYADSPELLPPAELLELRTHLAVAPRLEVRRAHLDAIVAQVRDGHRTPWGRVASQAARGAAAVAVTLTITTGLAAAQVLPEPAQKILSSVSDRFGGWVDRADVPTPPPEPAPAPVDDADDSVEAAETAPRSEPVRQQSQITSTTDTPVESTVPTTAPVTTTTSRPAPTTTTTTVAPTTTIPGPISSESPDPDAAEGSDGGDEPTEPEAPTEPTDPNAPTEPAEPTPTVPTNSGVRAVSDDGAGEEGGSG